VITHLDGRQLVVTGVAGQVITPDAVKVIAGEGMPRRGNVKQKGCLFVKFEIEYPPPEQLTPQLKAAFEKVLRITDEAAGLDENSEEVFPVNMQDGDLKQFETAQSSRERRNDAYSNREEEYEEAHGAQCQPM
jgi:DnaJ family protein A protein 2